MLDKLRQEASALLDQSKRDRYVRGSGCLEQAGALAGGLGSKALIIANNPQQGWKKKILQRVIGSLSEAGIGLVSERTIAGARLGEHHRYSQGGQRPELSRPSHQRSGGLLRGQPG